VKAWGWPRSAPDDDVFLGEVPVVDGRATVELVGLGLTLRLSACLADHSRASAWAEVAGPTRPDERVVARLQIGPEATRVVLRAVDELGAPLPEAKLEGEIELKEGERGTVFRFDATTTREGIARSRVDGLPDGARAASIRLQTRFTSELGIHQLRAEQPIPGLQVDHENDLGAIRCTARRRRIQSRARHRDCRRRRDEGASGGR
jgi:hypothetical protein